MDPKHTHSDKPATLEAWTGASTTQLLEEVLADQSQLTPVERFAETYDSQTLAPVQEKYFRELLPARSPEGDEQYAFDVDLDRCTGCKACVTACHSLNGLDDSETWRGTGLLKEASGDRRQQTVTSACHHCGEPGCLQGCPVEAYEKDDLTGAVVHLDDQCIGCQYCQWKCPYDVPQYNERLGIVRKCDFCIGRLQEGEAPACVQACPNQAIRISLVSRSVLTEESPERLALPYAPHSQWTAPATRYHSKKSMSELMEPVEEEVLTPEPAHRPLVGMLLLTQASAGLITFSVLFSQLAGANFLADSSVAALSRWSWLVAVAMVVVGVHTSLLHLGRPQFAFRAILGWKQSWLSREVLACSAWMGLVTVASLDILMAMMAPGLLPESLLAPLRATLETVRPLTIFVGWGAVVCSAMVYFDTPRLVWRTPWTIVRFLATGFSLGGGLWVTFAAFFLPSTLAGLPAAAGWIQSVATISLIATGVVLAADLRILRLQGGPASPDGGRSAALLRGPLNSLFRTRIGFALVGGLLGLLPIAVGVIPHTWLSTWAVSSTLALLVASFLERDLFFRSCARLKMPGLPRSSGGHA